MPPPNCAGVDKLDDEYLRAMTAAELSWIEGVIGDLQNGSLTWSYQEAAAADLRSGPAAVPE